ncbi:glycosyltransferase family 2 protein [Paenibacillus oenotherae]|uniref:Glycosyltransferase family 2 protein n=1 Tax=Paenibacillus oenotherae TaxID=1435645 RepID=A0ABS7D2T9_9BACL|nr:glycosyltransferase family 2 protein [Paenibacillus oenotherae]
MVDLSVIIPINKEDNLIELHRSITEAVRHKIGSYEIILVNDGSKDRTAGILSELAAVDKSVKVIQFKMSYGLTAAVWAGMRKSEGKLIALMDADSGTDPRDIFKLMPYIGKVDFVNGTRVEREGTLLRRLSSSRMGHTLLNWLTGDNRNDTGSPLKLMKREVADSYHLYNGMHRYLPTLASMNGYRVMEVVVSRRERKLGMIKLGVMNRALVWLMDAIVIEWLKRRVVRYQIHE